MSPTLSVAVSELPPISSTNKGTTTSDNVVEIGNSGGELLFVGGGC